MKRIIKTITWILLSSLFMLLAGCAKRGLTSNFEAAVSPGEYMQLAASALPPERWHYLLQAVSQYIANRQTNTAEQILDGITYVNLTPQQQMRYQLYTAAIALNQGRTQQAIHQLNALTTNNLLSPQDTAHLYLWLAQAYKNQGKILQALAAFNARQHLLQNPSTAHNNLVLIWSMLQTVPIPTLTRFGQTPNLSPDKQGWISLALIAADTANTPALISKLQSWQSQYPHHPANDLLEIEQNQVNPQLVTRPSRITLMVPLTGPLAASGQAIRNGFLGAYYAAKRQHYSPSISIVDTNNTSISDLYHQATINGSQFIVGPLTKQNLLQLTNASSITVPTLALNTLPDDTESSHQNLYQFGLSPLDAAKQAAVKAANTHHSRAIVIAPTTPWGQGVLDAFQQTWQSLGGTTVTTLRFTSLADLSNKIRSVLHIDDAKARARALSKTLNTPVRSTPRRRQDADMIFLATTSRAARQVRPLLRYYYAGGFPVYAVSTIYSGTPNTHLDSDLNGILFPDMPWVLLPPQDLPPSLAALRQQLENTWGNSFRQHTKLYALGVDAFHLISTLNRLALLPQFGQSGATGRLTLQSNHHIYRQLLWAQFSAGKPTLLTR